MVKPRRMKGGRSLRAHGPRMRPTDAVASGGSHGCLPHFLPLLALRVRGDTSDGGAAPVHTFAFDRLIVTRYGKAITREAEVAHAVRSVEDRPADARKRR